MLLTLHTDIWMIFYTTLPHNFIKDRLIDLIEKTFNSEGYPYTACNGRNAFSLRKKLKNIMHCIVKMMR